MLHFQISVCTQQGLVQQVISWFSGTYQYVKQKKALLRLKI